MKNLITRMKKAVAAVLASAAVAGGALSAPFMASQVNAAFVTPRLIVTGSEITTGPVNAGDDFELLIHLKNESTATQLNNVRIEFSTQDNEIIPSNGTNVVYIDSIDKEAEYDITVSLSARGDLQQKPYTLTLDYAYEDKDRNSFADSSVVTIPVVQIPEILLTELKLSRKEIVVDGKTNVSFALNNIGKDTVYNVAVEFEGEQIDDISTYVGNIDVSGSSIVDMSLKGAVVGAGNIIAHITFEDADGKSFSFDQSFELEVSAKPAADAAGEEKGTGVPVPVIAGGAAAVIIVIAVASIIRKKKERAYA